MLNYLDQIGFVFCCKHSVHFVLLDYEYTSTTVLVMIFESFILLFNYCKHFL